MEAIILAGGFGSRLRSVISDTPKPMAPIANKPFLCFLFEYLIKNEVNKVILSVGYRYEKIVEYYGNQYKGISIAYSYESRPLGTGGGIKKALAQVCSDDVFILNGDTYFDVNLSSLLQKHTDTNADITLSLKPMCYYNRYGSVTTMGDRVVRFEEKKFKEYGNINGGVYIAKSSIFDKVEMPEKFSFEADFLDRNVETLKIHAFIADSYFIDIGIPEDYEKAQKELPVLYE